MTLPDERGILARTMGVGTSKTELGRTRARLGAVALGLGAALVLAELATRAALALGGRPFDSADAARYVGTLHSGLVDAAPRSRAIDEQMLRTVRSQGQILHPYFGYDFKGYFANLTSELDYWRSPEATETYDIVVLGGSVAMNFLPDGVAALTDALRADPELAERPIRVLGQGRAAHKAPQQTMVLTFLLCAGAKPDAVLVLDGFNEVAVGLQNQRQGVAGTYPCGNIWLNLAGAVASNAQSLERALTMRTKQLAVVEAAEQYARFELSRFAATSWLATQRIERLRAEAAAVSTALALSLADSQGFAVLAGPVIEGDDAQQVEALVDIWRENVRSLHGLCAVRGVDFLAVLQPTALLEETKPLTDAERAGADVPESWRIGVRLGYPGLARAGAELVSNGVPWHDATRVFADVTEPLYFDACHFNAAGYERLARDIGRAFVAARATARSARR